MDSVPLSGAQEPLVLVIDIGTSSMRALVYDATATHVEGLIARRPYQAHTTADGGAELDAGAMLDIFSALLDELNGRLGNIEIAGVATSSLASSLVGVD